MPENPMDIAIENHGTIMMLRPLTSPAEEWLVDNVEEGALWFGNALAVEPRYVGGLLHGMAEEGFNV